MELNLSFLLSKQHLPYWELCQELHQNFQKCSFQLLVQANINLMAPQNIYFQFIAITNSLLCPFVAIFITMMLKVTNVLRAKLDNFSLDLQTKIKPNFILVINLIKFVNWHLMVNFRLNVSSWDLFALMEFLIVMIFSVTLMDLSHPKTIPCL